MNGSKQLDFEDAILSTNAEPLAAINVGILDKDGFTQQVITLEELASPCFPSLAARRSAPARPRIKSPITQPVKCQSAHTPQLPLGQRFRSARAEQSP